MLVAVTSYLFTGFACFTRRTSGARETLEVGNGGRKRRGLESGREQRGTPALSQPPDSCEASPGTRGSRQDLVHLSHQQGPVRRQCCGHGEAWERRGRGCPPSPAPLCPLPGLPVRDTYSRARGSLSSSFSVFASRTLWGESKEELSVVRRLEEERSGRWAWGWGVLVPL